ncbi:hypothetical protein D9Q98_005022 [Chlorella vulgaris]|uniref:Uncharacterized protein n=1 Tax=Chlorella vulgaris TaxID=3077 RepID=A0A9D4TNI8_CHLVU|nr:hypothetical protein D9Q98_005022 [Chlorella vulgaris]
MATVAPTSRLAPMSMVGRPASRLPLTSSRLPHGTIAGVSRTRATLPGGSGSGLYNLPVVARVASDDGARNTGGGAELELFTTEDIWTIVGACTLTPLGLIFCLHELEQNYDNGRQYWPLFCFVFFLYWCCGLALPLTYGYVRWQSRRRMRSQKPKQQE